MEKHIASPPASAPRVCSPPSQAPQPIKVQAAIPSGMVRVRIPHVFVYYAIDTFPVLH